MNPAGQSPSPGPATGRKTPASGNAVAATNSKPASGRPGLCCAKLQVLPHNVSSYPQLPVVNLNLVAQQPGHPIALIVNPQAMLPLVSTAAAHQQLATVGPNAQDNKMSINGVSYVVNQDMCVAENKVQIWKEKGDICVDSANGQLVCNADGCRRLESVFPTDQRLQQTGEDKADDHSAAEADRRSVTQYSQGGQSAADDTDAYSAATAGARSVCSEVSQDTQISQDGSYYSASQTHEAAASLQALSRQPMASSMSSQNLLDRSLGSSMGHSDHHTSADSAAEVLNVLEQMANSPTGSQATAESSYNSLDNIVGAGSAAATSTIASPEAGYAASDGDQDMDDVDGDNSKKVLRNAADERVVEKLFNQTDVTRDQVMSIASMPVNDLNKLMLQAGIGDAEASLVRDIRRRGKNKIAARNCRKRKLDNIAQLEKDVAALRHKHMRLQEERERVKGESQKYKRCIQYLRKYMIKLNRTSSSTSLQANMPSSTPIDPVSHSLFASMGQESLAGAPFSAQSVESNVFSLDNTTSNPNLQARPSATSFSSTSTEFLAAPSEGDFVRVGMEAVNNFNGGGISTASVTSVSQAVPSMSAMSTAAQLPHAMGPGSQAMAAGAAAAAPTLLNLSVADQANLLRSSGLVQTTGTYPALFATHAGNGGISLSMPGWPAGMPFAAYMPPPQQQQQGQSSSS